MLIEKPHNYQFYHQVKLIKFDILRLKKYCLLVQVKLYIKLNLRIYHLEKRLKNRRFVKINHITLHTKNKDNLLLSKQKYLRISKIKDFIE